MDKKNLKKSIIKRVLYALLIFSAFLIQCTVLPLTDIHFPIFILLPTLVCVAIFEKEFSGFFYGLFAGLLFDLASPLTDGLFALLLSAYACAVGLFGKYLLRNTPANVTILTFIGSVFYCVLSIILIPGTVTYSNLITLLETIWLPAVISAVILSIPMYFTVRAIALKLRDETIL